MPNYAVVRTDNMAGTDVRSMLVSVMFHDDGRPAAPAAIENGNVVRLGALMEGEREVHFGYTPEAGDDIKNIVLIATPELIYDERLRGLENFINEAGRISRGYRLHPGDFFSVTAEALTGVDENTAVGDIVELAASTKLNVVSDATQDSTVVGHIHAIETAGKYLFYVIQVD